MFKRSADLVSSRGGSNLGEYQEDGLPEIEGTLTSLVVNEDRTITGSGSFEVTQLDTSNAFGWEGDGENRRYSALFKASKSNTIYGNATQVQPKSVAITPILKY